MPNDIWRRFGPPIVLLVAILLMAFGAFWGWKQLTKPPTGHQPAPCVTQSASVLKTEQVTVQVLNAGQTAGRAGQVTEQLKNKGFVTKDPGNATEPAPETSIVGATADDAAVQLVAGFFPGAKVVGDGRTDGTVMVVVSDNFPGFNAEAPTERAVPGGTVCLPSASSKPA